MTVGKAPGVHVPEPKPLSEGGGRWTGRRQEEE
jgi:hypothetical protein